MIELLLFAALSVLLCCFGYWGKQHLETFRRDVDLLLRSTLGRHEIRLVEGSTERQHALLQRLSLLDAALAEQHLGTPSFRRELLETLRLHGSLSLDRIEALSRESRGTLGALLEPMLARATEAVLSRPLPATKQHWGVLFFGTSATNGQLVLLQEHGQSLPGVTEVRQFVLPCDVHPHATLVTWGPVLLRALRVNDDLLISRPTPFHCLAAAPKQGQKVVFQIVVSP